MLNLGQVVYDKTNKRLLIFGGVEVGSVGATFSFLTEDFQVLEFCGKKSKQLLKDKLSVIDFEYTNFTKDSVPGIKGIPSGQFIIDAGLKGNYFGHLDFEQIFKIHSHLKESIRRTFEEAKTWPAPAEPDAVSEASANSM